jgi:hypothetical protein
MTAFRLSGDWEVHLEPLVGKQKKNGLEYEHDHEFDRVIIKQGNIARQVGWYPRQVGVVLPLSGMIHPLDISEIQARVQTLLGLEPSEWKQPAEIVDPGRNAREYFQDTEQETEDDE